MIVGVQMQRCSRELAVRVGGSSAGVDSSRRGGGLVRGSIAAGAGSTMHVLLDHTTPHTLSAAPSSAAACRDTTREATWLLPLLLRWCLVRGKYRCWAALWHRITLPIALLCSMLSF